MTERSQREGFSSSVIQTLARRAGVLCSNPDCELPTSGPSKNPNNSVNVGVAAHIAAASPGGPRYNALRSGETRSAISNGIWLCQVCAKLIDSDPDRYTPERLQAWKASAERRAQEAIESRDRGSRRTVNAAVILG